MNLVAHPIAEVGVVQLAGSIFRRVEPLHDLHQVREVDRKMCPIDSDNVPGLDQAIMILVQSEECFIDGIKVARNLLTD